MGRWTILLLVWMLPDMDGPQAQVRVSARLEPDTILIGQPATLTLRVEIPEGALPHWPGESDLPGLELLQAGEESKPDDPVRIYRLRITAFDSGHYQIPPLPVQVGASPYYTPPLRLVVRFAPYDLSGDYRDIRELPEVNPAQRLPWLWPVSVAVLLLAAGLIWWMRRRKRQAEQDQDPRQARLSPFEEAMEILQQAEHQYARDGEKKAFYSAINEAVRRYLYRKLGMETAEQTNAEILASLQAGDHPLEGFPALADAMQTMDYVKFARYQPPVETDRKTLLVVKHFIRSLEQMTPHAV